MRDAREPADRLQGSDVPREEESAKLLRGAPMSVLFFVADGDADEDEAAAAPHEDEDEDEGREDDAPPSRVHPHGANDARPIAR